MGKLQKVFCLVVAVVLSLVLAIRVDAEESFNVKFEGGNTFVFHAEMTLSEIKDRPGYSTVKSLIDNPNFLTFINVETGKAVALDQPINSNITLKAINKTDKVELNFANVGVFTNRDAGITINVFLTQPSHTGVAKLMTDKFAYFVNVKTNEVVGLDDPIYVDTELKPIYYITVTVDGTDYTVLETVKLADLVQYAAKKDGYEFVAFTDEDGNAVTDASVVEGAKFISTYKEISVEPTTEATTPAETPTEASAEVIAAPEAQTAEVSNPQTLDNVLMYVGISAISLSVVSFAGYAISKRVRKA